MKMSNDYEKWQQDISIYGDDAYLFWKISLFDKNKFIDAVDNKDVEWAFNSTNYDLQRKTSTAKIQK